MNDAFDAASSFEKIPAGRLRKALNDYLPSEVEQRYEAVAAAFARRVLEGTSSKADLTREYEDKVFPLEQQRTAARSLGATCFDLLYLTAGTQPYSQTLSILATPAQKVVFIATDDAESRRCVETAIENTGIAEENREILTFPEPFSVADFVRVFYNHYRLNEDALCAVDITSGRKSMASALSGAAMALQLPQFYLNAKYLNGFAVCGERQRLPNLLDMIDVLKADADDEEGED